MSTRAHSCNLLPSPPKKKKRKKEENFRSDETSFVTILLLLLLLLLSKGLTAGTTTWIGAVLCSSSISGRAASRRASGTRTSGGHDFCTSRYQVKVPGQGRGGGRGGQITSRARSSAAVHLAAADAAEEKPVCVVTGASRGIGRAIALALGESGAKVSKSESFFPL